jgi:thioredoxin 1
MTVEEFEKEIKMDGFTLVDFWAPWCGPCKVIGPIVERLGESNPELKVLKIEVDDSPQLSSTFGIRSIPTLVLMKGDEVISVKVGVSNQKQIQSWIDEKMC